MLSAVDLDEDFINVEGVAVAAKGYTDQEKQDAGHKSDKMAKVYDRKGRLVMPADGEQVFESSFDFTMELGLKLD